ncbi:MAG: ABC transporter ATP-binding protein [Anaerolineales bacterium]|jgi:simple sugar transport system ATP-binding protein
MSGISKKFAGVVANDHIDFEIKEGEVHSLLGENGSGKSTLMKILYGIYRADEGRLFWKGEEIRIQSPNDAIARGIAMVHQHLTLIPIFSVAENFILGRRSPREPFLDMQAAAAVMEKLSQEFDISIDPWARVSQLDAGTQQWLEIIRALSWGADLLILDEPTSLLTPQETERLFHTIDLLAKRGKSVCFVTHKLNETMRICNRVTVLRRGKVVGTVDVCDTGERELARMMVGRDIQFHIDRPPAKPKNVVLKVDRVQVNAKDKRPVLKGVSLEIREGEILGIAGVTGNGQTELARALTGLQPIDSGNIWISDEKTSRLLPKQVAQKGVAYIPDQPWQKAALANFSLEQNSILRVHWQEPFAKWGVFRPSEISRHARSLIENYDIRTPHGQMLAKNLSGGNLQKLVLARELSRNPKLIIAVNPTAGLDVGAKEFVYKTLLEERNKGRAILLISADLDEVIELSDRIAVIYAGGISRIISADKVDLEELGFMMAGGKQKKS